MSQKKEKDQCLVLVYQQSKLYTLALRANNLYNINMAKRILLVEDEDLVIKILEKKLSEKGYEVLLSRNGKEGLVMMKKEKPDLILMDIVMPKMTGMEAMEVMNSDPELKKIPVIIVSNSGEPVEIERIKELGAKDWLIKTEFDPEEILEKVAKQIGK